ncbi:hypothetical protein V501_05723 [Pseudogymnoascus sp. VKM F-4519 (FW-2642)]|nr:hypothetical protein V501_05723 [Pseudogymnoascus sp. VKM F-4519 (FW-2642)]
MKQRQCPTQRALEQILTSSDPGAVFDAELVVQFVLPEPKDGDEISAGAEGHFDEPVPPTQHQPQRAWSRIKRFPRATNNNRNRPPHPLPIHAPLTNKDILPIKRDAEITIQRKETIRNPRKQLRKPQRLRRERRERAMANNPMRMIPKDILPRRAQLHRAMQPRRKIPREKRPQLAPPQPRRPHAQLPTIPGLGKHDVNHIRHNQRPQQRNRAGEQKRPDEQSDAQRVREDHSSLQPSL